ncbi:mucin-5AC protein [Spatholobus suberectus]|nr:mucin-5AC protein [Spatholobus suberectus]
MAQLERPQRQVDTSKTPTTIHTMEQLLRGDVSKSKQSPTLSSSPSASSSSPSSPFFQRLRHHDPEEEHGQNQKKSVLTKVKEKAKKLRHSLSKRKHEDGSTTSPSSVTGLEGDGVEEDAEYLGAPMYESEKAPAGYKANARQHPSPRGNPVTPEKHVISSSDKHVVEQDQGKTLSRSISKKTTTQPATIATTPNATTNTNANINTNTLSGSNKPISETVAQKLTPVHVGAPGAAHSLTSKMQGLTVSNSKPREHHDHTSSSTVSPKLIRNSSLSYAAPRTPPAKVPSQASSSTPRTASAPVTPAPASAPPRSGKNTSPTAQIWDKGVSMKEYLMNKLEPGEDEKALSQVISEAMSPRRTPGDAGVMEKVREAVTSLLRTEEPTKYADTNTTAAAATSTTTRASSQMSASNNASRASSQIPVSSNPQQDYAVAQEENHGRILQAN